MQECTSVFDEQGRFSPTFCENYQVLKCDTLVFAIGQGSELDFLLLFEKESGDKKVVAWTTPPGRDDTPEKAKPHEVRIPVGTSLDALPACDVFGKTGSVAVSDGAITLVLGGGPQYVHLPGRKPGISTKAAAEKRSPVRPEAVAAWDAKLLARVREEIQAGRKPRFHWTAVGDWADILEVGPKEDLRVQGREGAALVAWSAISLADRRNLAVALIRNGRAADHALAAFYLLALGERERAQPHLDKAGGAADEVRLAFK